MTRGQSYTVQVNLARGLASTATGFLAYGPIGIAHELSAPSVVPQNGTALLVRHDSRVSLGSANLIEPDDRLSVWGSASFTGLLSKGGGSFKIDHPLDPKNKYLYHSFVESPDMMNIYNGNATTDADGFATITLPDWFQALNKDFRYQLTIVDENAPDLALVRVARKIGSDAPNQFTIKTTPPGLEVSWQVTGIRQDAFANTHRIQTEVEKEPGRKGTYLHPEAFGKEAATGTSNALPTSGEGSR